MNNLIEEALKPVYVQYQQKGCFANYFANLNYYAVHFMLFLLFQKLIFVAYFVGDIIGFFKDAISEAEERFPKTF